MLKILIDIMGGGASAPHDMPIPKEDNFLNKYGIILFILGFIILVAAIGFCIDSYRKYKEKENLTENKTQKPKSYHYIDAEDEEEHK